MIGDWDELRLVLAIARAGTLGKAAESMRVDQSTIFRRLRSFEDRLGTKVFERRLGGRYCLTVAGEQIMVAAERIEAEAQALDLAISGLDHRLTGKIAVTSSETLAYGLLTRQIARFSRAHPGIQVELTIDNRVLSLSRREADIALRPVRPRESDLWGRKLADVAWAVYAPTGCTPGEEGQPFGGYPVVGWGESGTGIRSAKWMRDQVPPERIVYRSLSLLNQLVAVKAGMGVALLPCYLADAEPELMRISGPIAEVQGELWIVTHADLRRTARVRAFLDLVGEGLASQRAAFEGIGV